MLVHISIEHIRAGINALRIFIAECCIEKKRRTKSGGKLFQNKEGGVSDMHII